MPDILATADAEGAAVDKNKTQFGIVTTEAECWDNVQNNSFDIDVSGNTNVSTQCAGCLERDKKYKDLMKLYLKSTHRYSEMDHKFKDLLRTKTHSKQPEPDDTAVSTNDVFTPNEIKYLQSMPLSKSSDSTFILKCLEFAYKADPTVLRFKTLKGRPESVQYDDNGNMEQLAKKEPLSPIKVQSIKDLFIARLSKCQIDSVAFGERIKDFNVNRLFATGIINVSKKSK